jgi:SWI/SNF-related matrix-associated actin-dependent regulator of chromatin subfamily A-like protein 1
MGLGKTVQSLAIANYYIDEWPLFIIAPSSVKFMWKEKINEWLGNAIKKHFNVTNTDDVVQVIMKGSDEINIKKNKVVIGSYDLLAKNIDEIEKFNYKVVIVDECHLMKSGKAARTKAACRLLKNADRVILLSGTPALSRPSELYSQIDVINSSLFPNFYEFGMRYCDGKESRFGMDFSGASNMNELRILLEEKLLMRREKKDVILQLPSKMREMVILDPSLINLAAKALAIASEQAVNGSLKGLEKRGALLKYFQETATVKIKAVCDYCLQALESDKKFIVFAHHKSMLDALEEACIKEKHLYIRIDGRTSSQMRHNYVEDFQKRDDIKIALLSITAASTGITLTAAQLVIFAELFWNPGILVQVYYFVI